MPSPNRLSIDTYYHIYNRGVNRENIFLEERNYGYFLNLYGKYIEPVAETFSYCLMKNHFHLLIRTKSEEEILAASQTLRVSKTLRVSTPEPSTSFSNFFNAYAKGINKTYGRTGSLFQHPFGRVVISSDIQFHSVVCYIHQNPQKHEFVEDFRDWQYSSYDALISEKPTLLQRTIVLDWFGGRDEYAASHAHLIEESQSKLFAGDDDWSLKP
jgi:REP element-mobilizing transposase RayT